MRFTPRDESLTHQVRLINTKKSRHIFVSCTCQADGTSYWPMAQTNTMEDTVRIYNDPKNHKKPFREEDELKWRAPVKHQPKARSFTYATPE